MRADEALKASPDGKIYLEGKEAMCSRPCTITWTEKSGSRGMIDFQNLFSDRWEPTLPEAVEKCEACQDAATHLIGTFQQAHLKKYHCTCPGGGV